MNTTAQIVTDTVPVSKNIRGNNEDAQLHQKKTESPEKKNGSFLLQPKLTVGAPDDPYEKEADAVADQVMRMPEKNFVQKKCAACEKEEKIQRETEDDELPVQAKPVNGHSFIQKKCSECKEEEDKEKLHRKPLANNITPFIQAKSNGASVANDSVSASVQSSRGGGSSLDGNTQSFMESRFGADFSSVKIHTGSESIQMNKELNAQAFTVGSDIYFNDGKYQPNSSEGKHLLAHELTHVVQQNSAGKSRQVIQRQNISLTAGELSVVNVLSTPRLHFIPADIHSTRVGPEGRITPGLPGDTTNRMSVVIGEGMTFTEMAQIMLPLWNNPTPFTPAGSSTPVSFTPLTTDELARGLLMYNFYHLGGAGFSRWQAGVRVPMPVFVETSTHTAVLHPLHIRDLASGFDAANAALLTQPASPSINLPRHTPDTAPIQQRQQAAAAFLAQYPDNASRGGQLLSRSLINARETRELVRRVLGDQADTRTQFDIALAFMNAAVTNHINILRAQEDGTEILGLVEMFLTFETFPDLDAATQADLDRALIMLAGINFSGGIPVPGSAPACTNGVRNVTIDFVLLHGNTRNPLSDLQTANQVFQNCCVRLEVSGHHTADQATTHQWLNNDNNLVSNRSCSRPALEERQMRQGSQNLFNLTGQIKAFYVDTFTGQRSDVIGYAFTRECGATTFANHLVIRNNANETTLAHEVGHLLLNAGHWSALDNLMHRTPTDRRLTPNQCRVIFNRSLQPKLNIGFSDDAYEKEADDMADKVMRMPDQDFIQRKCAECEKEDKEKLHRKPLSDGITPFIQAKSNGASVAGDSLTSAIHNSRGSGSSIDINTQNFMERRFGADFSSVKIHTGKESARMNKELNAQAFTVGSDIFFNEGKYQPNTSEGKHLLAHELTHTIQQNGTSQYLQKKNGDRSPDRKVKALLLAQIKDEKLVSIRFNILFTDNSTGVFEIEWDLKKGEELDVGKKYQIESTGLTYVISSKEDTRKYSLVLRVTDKSGKTFYSYDLDNASSSDPVAQSSIEDMRILNAALSKSSLPMDAGIIDLTDSAESDKAKKGDGPVSPPVKEKPVLSFKLPSWFADLKNKIEKKIDEDRKANPDNPYLPDKIFFYGSDKVQLKKGGDAWTIEVEKGNGEAYYTVLKKQWDEAGDKDEFTNKTTVILYEKVQLLLTKPPESNKEIYEIDGSGEEKNKFKEEGDKPKANPFSGLKKEELEKLRSMIKDLTGDTKPDEKTPPPKVPLTPNDIEALLQLADDPSKEKIVAYLKAKTGGGVTSTKSLEELIAIAKLKDAYTRFEIKTDSTSQRQEPIVNRPVHGDIVQPDPLIVAHKPVSFSFRVRDDVDAFRVPHIFIRWFAYTDPQKNHAASTAPKDWKETDWVDYIPINDEGLLNRKHSKFEFPAEGIYAIEAIVDHNFFLPNHFRTAVKVLDEQKVLKEKEEKTYNGFLKEGTTTEEDFGQLSFGKGMVTKGRLDDKFKGATAEEQLKVIDEEIKRIKQIIEEYKKKGTEGEPMTEWGEKYLEKLQSNRDNIAKTAEDKSQNLIAAMGVYVSRTEGVKTADLKLSCFVKKDTRVIPPATEFDEGSEEEGYRVTLYDYTQLYENENYTISAFATSSEAAMKQVFSTLSESYPDGHISLAFQKWDDAANKKSDEYIKYTRVTDTIGKKVKKVAFSTPVNIAVNVIAAVLAVFPPTTGVGIAIGILYNGSQTISELQEQADKGTLTGKKVMIGCGSMLLDILPVLGTAGKAAKIVRVGTKAYYVVEGIQLAGQALLVYETGMEQVEKIRTDFFIKIAELDDQIAELERNNPSDPQIDELKKSREKLMNDGRDATVKVLGEMAAQQLAFTVGGKLLHGVHEHYSAKSKFEARGKIADSLTGVEKLSDGERLALADKIYDNDIPIKASKETGWKKEGDRYVLEISDNATHAEIDALIDKNPNQPGTSSTGAKKQDVEKVSSSPVDAESKTPLTATNEVHEHFIHEDGTITRCSDRCARLVDNTTDRASDIRQIFGKDHPNSKKAKELKQKAVGLQKEAKEASTIKENADRQTKEKEILEKAKQLELELASLEKAMISEIEERTAKSMDDITAFLEKYPEYKGTFERRIKNRNERKKEITPKLNDPDSAIKQQAIEDLRNEERLARELLNDMKKHADNMAKPDISKRYNYYETTNKQGDHVKVAEGELGVPGQVMKHRSQSEQAKVSAGSGDDAGHLIANIFGAEGGERNLGKQNWIANEFGTWRQLEIMWAEKLLNGTKVSVKIREVAKVKGERPFMREAVWTEVDPSGNATHHRLTFGNFETVKSRAATGATPTPAIPEDGATVFIWNQERSKRGLEPVYSQQELQAALEYLHGQSKAENDIFNTANDNEEL